MENIESLMESLEVKDALAASRESVKQHYGRIRDALRNHRKKLTRDGKSTVPALRSADGPVLKAGDAGLPALHGSDHEVAGVIKALGGGCWSDMLEAAHYRAMNSSADTGQLKMLSAMYFSRGGKDMFEKLKDSQSRNQVMAAALSRQIVEYEGVSQLCTTMINAIGLEKIQDGFDDDGSFLQNLLKTKLCIDCSQREAIQAMGSLGCDTGDVTVGEKDLDKETGNP